ncbi:CDP-glycerol:glycerophosphate glycerophosphotransferase [Methanobrevibacter sp.]|uniref:CDP-glycerol:glycerophosphate glycerophosphotransferase n=1 Tax=Methanobrevibacter sp. TaxID=66852 RepID=UPI00388D26B5
MSEFEFSVIILTHNSELGIKQSIDCLINQTLDFIKHTEIIIIDQNSEDNAKKICEDYIKKYPNNIKFIPQDDYNLSEAKNLGIRNASGKFLTFLEIHDYYSKDSLKNLLDYINKNKELDLIALPIFYFKNNHQEHYLNHKIKKTETINLLKQPEYAEFLGLSTFFKRDSCKNIKFLDANNNNITFFSEILINNPILGICNKGKYYSINIDEKIYPTENLTVNQTDYDTFLKYNFNELIEKTLNKFSNIPQFIQFNLANHLRWILSVEKAPEKIDLSELIDIMQYIDDDVILNTKLLKNDLKIISFLLKYGSPLNENLMEKLDLNTIFIDNYDIIDNELRILVSAINIYPRNIDVIVNNEKINKKVLRFPQKDIHSLNNDFCQDYSIEAAIPISQNEKFELEFKEGEKKLHIDFSRPCNFSKIVGYAKTRHYLSILKNDKIIISKKSTSKWIMQEIKCLANILKTHERGFEKAIPFRIAYMLGYPFMKNKKIWFYMDRPNESDDNGLALFKYSVKQDEDIDRYFILSSQNKDYNDIQKIGKVIPYKSLKHNYLALFTENIITSHPDNEIIYPFWGGYPFIAGLLRSNTAFLQHGILKDNISSWLNKSNMNISMFLVSSTNEYESTFKYPYNYDDNVIQMLGLPRYDTLENKNEKRQIIIMPSWRRDLDHKSKEYVKENVFFKKFNSLINNEKLISKAKEKNYEIIFRPHPKVYEYIDLFDKNDYVKIDYDKVKYQTLFNNSSLMITDYSSVAFDFAYLYKPVVYYQFGSDYHFDLDESYFNYETMGFGEIARTEEELVDLIIDYIENECKIKDKYHERISKFFVYNDKNNCKRVHDKIKEIPLKD